MKHILVQDLNALLERLKKSKNNEEKNRVQVNLIKSRLRDFREERYEQRRKKVESPNEIVDIVEKILSFNRQQQGQGLKILTPSPMLSRLPISLARLKAGNNSEKLKNEIRQLLYSLYRSKKLTKTLYNNLINTVLTWEQCENSKTNESNKFIYQFTDKLNLNNPNKNIGLVNLSICYTWKNIKYAYNNNKVKISTPAWNDKFDMLDESYSISDIQNYFEYVISTL